MVKSVDVQQKSLFPNLWKVFNRKIQYLLDFSLNEPKGSDALTVDKIIQIFNHQKMDSSTLRRLLYQIFFYNAILLELRGKEYFKLDVFDNISPINSMNINKKQVNRTFLTVKEVLKQSNHQNIMSTKANTFQIPLKSNNQVEIEMKFIQLQELLESDVLANIYLHIKLS
uniref:Uncharacterized protein n=1 Tax=Rhizophagus irregularis (strain DAOM 181602 / DAOM 197198 / MUCL 43194) TaxID=747089 RepID=U9U8L6_RHIID